MAPKKTNYQQKRERDTSTGASKDVRGSKRAEDTGGNFGGKRLKGGKKVGKISDEDDRKNVNAQDQPFPYTQVTYATNGAEMMEKGEEMNDTEDNEEIVEDSEDLDEEQYRSEDEDENKKENGGTGDCARDVYLVKQNEDRTVGSSALSNLSEDYFQRLEYGGNIFDKKKILQTARSVANNYMWSVIKFITKNDTDLLLYKGELCQLVIRYTMRSDGYFRDFFGCEKNQIMYWKVAQKVLRNALFRKRSAVSTAIKNRFLSK
jgi:hypothetical protein